MNYQESNAVTPDDLFGYASGRWLINDEYQQKQRFVKFDIGSLSRLAASLFGDTTKCARIDKLEGNFNKAFILTMNDGNEVIAKVPCPNAGPPLFTTASEVATLKFRMYYMSALARSLFICGLRFRLLVRLRTSVRVPEVFAWCSDSANPVGAEFIIMEKIPGVALAERWETMKTLERYKVIDQVIETEKELATLKFPAYGSLFLRDSLPDRFQRHPLPPTLDPDGLFCIGPSCNRSWWHGTFLDTSKKIPEDVGPC